MKRLKVWRGQSDNNKNSATFSNYNRNDAISTDAISFYANVPIFDALNITEDKVNRDDQFTRETAITQDKFLDLVDL